MSLTIAGIIVIIIIIVNIITAQVCFLHFSASFWVTGPMVNYGFVIGQLELLSKLRDVRMCCVVVDFDVAVRGGSGGCSSFVIWVRFRVFLVVI